jgi:RNA-binding protein
MKGKQKAWLKKKAHNMPVNVMIGDKGITESLVKSMEDNLQANELVKISISHPDRDVRKQMSEELANKTNSIVISIIGKTTIFYRENMEKQYYSKELGKL